MESSRSSKRRRLISISSNVLPQQRPDAPATFESLNDDTLSTTLEFVGNKSYATYGGINKHCKEVYLATPRMTKETFIYGYGPLPVIIDRIERAILGNDWDVFERVGKGVVLYNRKDVLDWALQQRNENLLTHICEVAAVREGRTDILDEVWNKEDLDEDDKENIFGFVDQGAACHGKLNVLKWVETKGLSINNMTCCALVAARHGQLHILEWLKEEKGLKLFEGLYNEALRGDHLHVMKWLREQEVDWSDWTFYHAAVHGNLEILQWLHDEGCTWPDDDEYYHVNEDRLKPEVIDWCRVNGYGNRLYND